jgi:hypothetical protein
MVKDDKKQEKSALSLPQITSELKERQSIRAAIRHAHYSG